MPYVTLRDDSFLIHFREDNPSMWLLVEEEDHHAEIAHNCNQNRTTSPIKRVSEVDLDLRH